MNLLYAEYKTLRFYACFDLKDKWMSEMLGFARFVVYDNDDVAPLYVARNEAE